MRSYGIDLGQRASQMLPQPLAQHILLWESATRCHEKRTSITRRRQPVAKSASGWGSGGVNLKGSLHFGATHFARQSFSLATQSASVVPSSSVNSWQS